MPEVLRPDTSPDDYVRFYDRIGGEQLEERYYARHGYAVARHHLISRLLAPSAKRGEHLLDVGCASGYYSVRYARTGGRVTGVDVAESSLELARLRARREGVAERCAFTTGDLRALPQADGTFGAVLATEVFEHVREQREALAELTRVLRPGGLLLLSSPGAFDELPFRRRLALRGAPSAEAAGVAIERTGRSDTLEAVGIEHEAYFHDAFTLPGLRALAPPELEVVSARSLLFTPPRAVTYGFLAAEGISRRARRKAAVSLSEEPEDGLVRIPDLYGEARAIMRWTQLLWRLPAIREAGVGALLVGRRR